MKKLMKIEPFSAGKVVGLGYAIVGLIAALFSVFSVPFAHNMMMFSGPVPFIRTGMGLGILLFFPIVYGVMGFVMGSVGSLVYNFVVQYTGGIEIELK